jgi:hypothetical protein
LSVVSHLYLHISNHECPLDHSAVEIPHLRPSSRPVKNMLNRMIVHCDNSRQNTAVIGGECAWQGEWSSLSNHLLSCEFVEV